MASSKLSKTPAPSTVALKSDATPTPPPVVEAPKPKEDPSTALIATVITLDTAELKKVLASARLELKVREEALASKRPHEGETVQISKDAPKRWAGRKGTVLLAGKSRVFVKVDGFIQAANVPLAQVERVEA